MADPASLSTTFGSDDGQLGYRATQRTPESATSDTPLASQGKTRFAVSGLPPGAAGGYPPPGPALHEGIHQEDRARNGSFSKLDEEKRRPGNTSRFSSNFSQGAQFDTRDASQANLQFAEGDFVKTPAGRFYAYLLNLSIVTRWLLYIVPIAGLMWIPGIVGLTVAPGAMIFHVKLLWWSIWMSALWVGWWAALAAALMLPTVLRWTVGFVAVSSRHYIQWFSVLTRYVAFFVWAMGAWISYRSVVMGRFGESVRAEYPGSAQALDVLAKLLFGLMLCAATLIGEKFIIQFIAMKFHEDSYADRIAEQKRHIETLITLYARSADIPGRSDTLKDGTGTPNGSKRFFRGVLKGVRGVADTATTALGNVASEITGSSTLQPSSPEARVYTALSSANKARLLARRLFYSFREEGSSVLVIGDISRFFPNLESTQAAFAMFDKDSNGDATREEVEMACLDVHRELMSLSASISDIDSAVRRLDNIFMSVYLIVAALIMAVALDTSFSNILTAAGSLVLGLSWLIGGAASEVLLSIIFLFIKHPYDIGDTVEIDKAIYTVKEILLLSTIFIDSNGCSVQAPHTGLTTQFIRNHRRSGAESETVQLDVKYDTSFEKIEDLRAKMLGFLESHKRDFQPTFDVAVQDIPAQEKMVLQVDIHYKSNNQFGALRSKRRNMWMCALKTCMLEIDLFGPKGDPHAKSGPTPYTLVPWEDVDPTRHPPAPAPEKHAIRHDFNFADKNALLKDNADAIFGEESQMNLTNPRSPPSRSATNLANVQAEEAYEMQGHHHFGQV